MSKIKISVVVITYNQEKLISRAIESIVLQKDYIYEIIICDDCSQDNTFNVLKVYQSKYPELIRLIRNKKNLGIFGNLENSWTLPRGNAVTFLSGDDTFKPNFFKHVFKAIEKNRVDFENDKFCIYFNYDVKYPKLFYNLISRLFYRRHSNSIIRGNFNLISLKIRGLIVNRTIIYSRKLLHDFYSVPKDIGIFADGLLDIQVQQFATHNYYYKYTASTYYAKIGVSKKTPLLENLKSQRLLSEEYKKKFSLSQRDIAWLDFIDLKNELIQKPSAKLLFLSLKRYFQSVEPNYGIRGLQIKKLMIDLFKLSKIVFYSRFRKINKGNEQR